MSQSLELRRPDAVIVGEVRGEAPEALLLHAGGETRAVWRTVMDALAVQGFGSVAYDQRGHGESGGSVADGIVEYGNDAGAMISKMNFPVVVGASLGGFALMLALERLEDKVAGLVLVDVTPAPDPVRTRNFLAPRGGLESSPLVNDILSKSDQLTRIVDQFSLPILLVCGGARSPLDSEARTAFSRLAPHAEIMTIERAGHLVARDAPDELARLLGEFMQTQPVRSRRHG